MGPIGRISKAVGNGNQSENMIWLLIFLGVVAVSGWLGLVIVVRLLTRLAVACRRVTRMQDERQRLMEQLNGLLVRQNADLKASNQVLYHALQQRGPQRPNEDEADWWKRGGSPE